MSKKLLTSCLTIGLILSVIPSTAEAILIRGRGHSRGSATPTHDTTVYYGIEDSNRSNDKEGLFRNAISSSYISSDGDLLNIFPADHLYSPGDVIEGRYFARDSDSTDPVTNTVDLLSNFDVPTRIVTYSFRPNEGSFVTYLSLDLEDSYDVSAVLNNSGLRTTERITNVFLSREIPADESHEDYVNNIDFILDNDILADPWLSVETESGFIKRLHNPSGFGVLDEESLCSSGSSVDDIYCELVDDVLIREFESSLELPEEIVPESNLLSGLAGILMLGFFKFLTNKNSQVSKEMSDKSQN